MGKKTKNTIIVFVAVILLLFGIFLVFYKFNLLADINRPPAASPSSSPSTSSLSPLNNVCRQSCPNGVTVQCTTEEKLEQICGIGSNACSYGGECKIVIENSVCSSHGLAENKTQVLTSEQLRDLISDNSGTKKGHCDLIHELAHACDAQYKTRPKALYNCGENFAFNYDFECMRNELEIKCGLQGIEDECKNRCRDLMFLARYKIYDACLCQQATTKNPKNVTKNDCCWCAKECENNERVKSIVPSVCYQNGWVDDDLFQNRCKDLIHGPHSCEYWGGPILTLDACISTATPAVTRNSP